ncbi:MAG: enoyl-CoA hydratase-related protein [Saprospiraceae bacterium]
MQYATLLTTLENRILIITINRPKALNALNYQVFSDLDDVFTNYAPSIENLIGVIITGSGEKSFVAGADIKEFTKLDANGAEKLSARGQRIFDRIENFNRPVIAAVNGFSLGGGCELAMACHMRIAGEKARFGQPEVNLGLTPGYAGTQRLVRYIGKAKAIELLLTADMIKADEALRLGLVNYVVPVGEEVIKAIELLTKIGKKAPFAVSKVIECVNAYYTNEDGQAKEAKSFGECAETEDFIEGVTAFIEKRKANFKGK